MGTKKRFSAYFASMLKIRIFTFIAPIVAKSSWACLWIYYSYNIGNALYWISRILYATGVKPRTFLSLISAFLAPSANI